MKRMRDSLRRRDAVVVSMRIRPRSGPGSRPSKTGSILARLGQLVDLCLGQLAPLEPVAYAAPHVAQRLGEHLRRRAIVELELDRHPARPLAVAKDAVAA